MTAAAPTTTAADTTTAAGGPTTTAAVPTTTAAGPTTTAAVPTTAAVVSTTAAAVPTTAAGAAPTTAPPCVPPSPGAGVHVACELSCCPATAGNKTLVWTVDTSFSTFDCPSWVALLATAMNVLASDLRICSLQQGSALVGTAASNAQQDQIVVAVASGSVALPGATKVLDTSTGRSSKFNFLRYFFFTSFKRPFRSPFPG
jgi:hypothetical protein